jgi:hypothetical protein
MHIGRSTSKTFVLFCFLLFQVQLFASAAIGCGHDAGSDQGLATAACQYHQGSGEAEMPLECHACALHLAIGGAVQAAAEPLPALPMRSVTEPASGLYFYRFTPGSPFKPPIATAL